MILGRPCAEPLLRPASLGIDGIRRPQFGVAGGLTRKTGEVEP